MSEPVEAFRAAILAALGHAPETIEPGKLHRFSTNGKASDTAGWCKLFDDLRGGVFGCYRQTVSEVWGAADRGPLSRVDRAELMRRVAIARAERQAEQLARWAVAGRRIAELQTRLLPLTHRDPVALYLGSRGFAEVWPLPECLRLHPCLPYWHAGDRLGEFPAMVAPLVAPDGRTVALHRTYLQGDGRKADVPTVRKLTGAAGPLAGACIPLFKPAHGCIGIAEGIETALAAWRGSGVPTVAAYSAGNLAAWHWPAGVQRLVIFADHDPAGTDAAEKLQCRALRAGLRVNVMTPNDAGADWCDVWAGRGAALVEGGAA